MHGKFTPGSLGRLGLGSFSSMNPGLKFSISTCFSGSFRGLRATIRCVNLDEQCAQEGFRCFGYSRSSVGINVNRELEEEKNIIKSNSSSHVVTFRLEIWTTAAFFFLFFTWWAFRPRKKYLAPPPLLLADILAATIPTPPRISPPFPLFFSKRKTLPPPPARTLPSFSPPPNPPQKKKIRNVRQIYLAAVV